MTDRTALHCYVQTATHAKWHTAATRRRLTVSAVVEALGSEIDKLLDEWPGLEDAAALVDAERRARR